MNQFKNLGLSENLLKAIEEMGFETPSEIQGNAIPILNGEDRDFIGLAQTGTGKTAAFGLPLLDKIKSEDKVIQALILAPTRELGQQISQQLKLFGKHLGNINTMAVYGGASIGDQIRQLKKSQHILIATPGRLNDLIRRKAVQLNSVKYLILDEADEMLNMGFKEDLDAILSQTPDSKFTWLFSATMPNEIKKIVNTYMDNPIEVKINPKNLVNTNIGHYFVKVHAKDKTEALIRFLEMEPDMRGIVFCRTRIDAQSLSEGLIKKNYPVDSLHGDLSQSQRDRVMTRFKSGDLHVLVATDVAARGIDVNDLTHIFHFSLPDGKEFYTHRSGRTARAGKKGVSIAFIGPRENNKIARIANLLKIQFNQLTIPDSHSVRAKRIESWCKNVSEYNTDKIPDSLVDVAYRELGKLHKEELIKKFISVELHKIGNISNHDLNPKDVVVVKEEDKKNKSKSGRPGRKRRQKNGNGFKSFMEKDKGRESFNSSAKGKKKKKVSKKKKTKKKSASN